MVNGTGALEAVLELCLDAEGIVREANAPALQWINGTGESVLGAAWQQVLAPDSDSATLLQGLLLSGFCVSLPPLLMRVGDSEEGLYGGMVSPSLARGSEHRQLQLWALQPPFEPAYINRIGPADTVAVIAVDQLLYDDAWGVVQTAQLVGSMRSLLLEIVRGVDTVGPGTGSTIPLILSDVDASGASDICRAILSHLHGALPRLGDARLCVGLARCSRKGFELSTVLAASRAALLSQYSGAQESIRVADESDIKSLLGQLLSVAGMFVSGEKAGVLPAVNVDAAKHTGSETVAVPPPLVPIETGIEGYVVDNMEGAVDQALFLARLDVPVGIVGAAGTGKMYIARVIHEETRAAPDALVAVDCREFRSRISAMKRVANELRNGAGKTLVFKSPHLMHIEAQQKLARQLSTRTLADVSPRRYLPQMKLIALFPEPLDVLVERGELAPTLASVFSAYPIKVPPIRDRKQAVLRWAHKILGQEGALRDRPMKGFTPDAERAMLVYGWPGNISEMRVCIQDALEKTDKDWLTPVDLGLYEGLEPEGLPESPDTRAFLELVEESEASQDAYEPTTTEGLDVALGEAVHDMLALELIKPLGSWLEDDLVLAVLDRYRQDVPKAAIFLHTSARNIRRWLPKIEAREEERSGSSLWQKPRRLLRDWVRETPPPEQSPLVTLHDSLMLHLQRQGGGLSTAKRANVMGVSTPTFVKRLRQLQPG